MTLPFSPSSYHVKEKPSNLKSASTLKFSNSKFYYDRAIVDGKVVNRKYTPISRIDRKETFQLLIKIYHKT